MVDFTEEETQALPAVMIEIRNDLIDTPELDFNKSFWPGWESQIEISSALAQLKAVRSGAGIGILHDFTVRDAPELVPLFPETKAERSY